MVDGPLRGRSHLPRALGYIKSHRAAYLPPDQHAMIGTLQAGQRTPVFRMGTNWDRHSWYLRLPCLPSAPWSGIVRVECSPDLPVDEVVALANLSQVTLVRFASTEYKDARAPQNLYPIAGLERELRRTARRFAAAVSGAAGGCEQLTSDFCTRWADSTGSLFSRLPYGPPMGERIFRVSAHNAARLGCYLK